MLVPSAQHCCVRGVCLGLSPGTGHGEPPARAAAGLRPRRAAGRVLLLVVPEAPAVSGLGGRLVAAQAASVARQARRLQVQERHGGHWLVNGERMPVKIHSSYQVPLLSQQKHPEFICCRDDPRLSSSRTIAEEQAPRPWPGRPGPSPNLKVRPDRYS